MPRLLKTLPELRAYVTECRAQGSSLGFVPTMGALHTGHLTLITTARQHCDRAIASIFVNPKQFAPHEDFDRYPRALDRDAALLDTVGADALFAPEVDVMYPPDFQTRISIGAVAEPLEGEYRPHFFSGVATVVARLLLLVGADAAFFGEKDYQQLQVIKALQRDLAIPTTIIGVPTVRDENGLALSSRNAYLDPAQKEIATTLNRTLAHMAARCRAGDDVAVIERDAHDTLLHNGFDKIDYITVRDAISLRTPTAASPQLRVLAAAWIGTTRLIDNMAV